MSIVARCAHAVLVVAAVVPLAGGCATTWITTQVAGSPHLWDEDIREESVPLPGFTEQLVVGLPLGGAADDTTGATGATGANHPTEPVRFAVACTSQQRARDVVYHQAFRYGRHWKKQAALATLLEGLLATAFVVSAGDDEIGRQAAGVYFGVDALVTAGLMLLPRKEIYRRDERPVTTGFRTDCPDGLVLEIGGERFPVDAAGHIGERGEVLLDDWMATPSGSLRALLGDGAAELVVSAEERCAWASQHHADQPRNCSVGATRPTVATTTLTVAPGTLTSAPVGYLAP